MASDPPTTNLPREATRTQPKPTLTGGKAHDDLLHAIVAGLKERDPWLAEMERRISDWRTGKVELEPIETLWEKDRRSQGGKAH